MTTKKNRQHRQQDRKLLKMVNKNKRLAASVGVNKTGTKRQQVSTKMLTVLTAKTSALSTKLKAKSRAVIGFEANVDEIDDVDSYNATSQKTFLN